MQFLSYSNLSHNLSNEIYRLRDKKTICVICAHSKCDHLSIAKQLALRSSDICQTTNTTNCTSSIQS